MVEAVGFLAGILTTIAYLPQLLKAWKTQSTKDVSLGMLVVTCTGVLLWLIYGLLIQALPVILANLFTLVLASAVLLLKLRHG
jgi:MtN3 and saliva related transmembrane protein